MPALRIVSEREGLPPLIVVQGGPGLPIYHEIPRYRRLLGLEREFSVAYWEQPGSGPNPPPRAEPLCLDALLEELRSIIRTQSERAGAKATLLGVSLGATLALRAAELEGAAVASVIAVSPDLDVAAGDAHAFEVLCEEAKARGDKRLLRRITRLGPPPYPEPERFGERLRLVADSGGIEAGKGYAAILAGTALRLLAAYGPFGAAAAMRNLAAVQAALLSELSTLDLFEDWPEVETPVHWLFGSRDPLTAQSTIDEVRRRMKAADSLAILEEAGHLAHFDRPDGVAEAVLRSPGRAPYRP
jgi:pimeloyl-ACP methyl ester carboxylesterase